MLRKTLFSTFFAIGLAVFSGQALAHYATADLNMRTGPGVRYARIAVIPAGGYVSISYCRGSWCLVVYRGISGWASARYLTDGAYRPRVYRTPPPTIYFSIPPYLIYRDRHRHHYDYRRHRYHDPRYSTGFYSPRRSGREHLFPWQ